MSTFRSFDSRKSLTKLSKLWNRKTTIIAAFSVMAILLHLTMRFGFHLSPGMNRIPLLATLIIGGVPMIHDL